HAPMEPPTALADVQGDKVLVRAPVQDPQSTRGLVAQWMETDESNITVLPTLLGGAFGRKSKPDYVLEAVELSKRLKRPVRVQWSRENDIHHDYFHAASAQFMKATLGDDGKPNAWLQRTAFPTITTTFSDQALDPAEWELEMGFTNTPYQTANQRFEATGLKPGVRVGWMRSVCNIFHSFSANSFVDELANAANADPIDYRFSLWPEKGILSVPGMQPPEGHGLDIGRMRDVLDRVRKLSRWDEPREPGVGLGVAIHHSFRSYVATVIEVRASNASYTVDNAYVVLDCGTHINTDTCVAQMEGAVIFGLSLAQQTEITMSDGSVDQSNFDDYPVLRMPQGPATLVEIVESDALPAGVGEPGVPPVAPALVNAIFAVTGKRIRKLPIQLT
ncbi:MAG TPA: twin-arginine translocation pathway signal protein, partial [Gammaproteobacteria bacterium]|nr:twin-arginine translocation pathway signal protein [Gammaproteobacteria bacterium]